MPVLERILAVLALVAGAVTVIALLQIARRRVAPWLVEVALPLATAIALVASAGSLALSEIAGYTPCVLCWYQRIAMYPLTMILLVAAVRRDRAVWLTAVPVAGTGAGIAIWHVAIERNPSLAGDVCDPAAPCALRWVEEFGFLTLPTMALIGFLAIIVLTLVARHDPASDHDDVHDRLQET